MREVAERVESQYDPGDPIVVAGAFNTDSARFVEDLAARMRSEGFTRVTQVVGHPHDLRSALEAAEAEGHLPVAVAMTGRAMTWRVLESFPSVNRVVPDSTYRSDFLKRSNLLAVVDRIVVIAVIVVCGMVGLLSGYVVFRFRVAAFITTLGVMMMARGAAFMITGGFSIYQVPSGMTWLGQGTLLGLPNTVILLVVLYTLAHLFMSRTRLGRYIYAVGGNEEAARLSGVPVGLVVPLVYAVSGLCAGLGGAIQASQINAAAPNMGVMYELYVIAAVVIGGTSLSGGSGRVLGTLIGAFIISVLQNGMNLLGVESYTQQVILGGVILLAVLLDKVRGGRVNAGRKSAGVGRPVWRNRDFQASVGAGFVLLAGAFLFTMQRRDEGDRIGMTCMDLTNPFFKLIANVMEEEAEEEGFALVALSSDLDAARQNNQLNDFAAQGYDAVFINPVDSEAAGAGVKQAWEAGIPVFSFDVQVTAAGAGEMVASHIGSDNYQGGRLAADSMIEATGGRGDIAIISFPEITSCIYRVDGFKDVLRERGSRLRIVAELSGKGNRNDGYAVATDILQAHPDIVGLFAINDPSALGAHAAVAKAGRQEDVVVIGFDASPAGKQAVFEEKLYDTPQQFPRKMAVGTVEALVRYLEGRKLPENIFIPCAHYLQADSINDESRISEQW